tara:strand:- start:2813 stop:3334 length:522 start_codon:yes stop_codon:yes gene_type:complete
LSPTLFLTLASTVVSTKMNLDAANAAKAQGRLQARQFDQQGKNIKFTALQNHNQRMRNLSIFQNTNESILGTTGRDYDRSYSKIIDKAKKDALTDVSRMGVDTAMKLGQTSLQKSLTLLQAQNRANAYRYQALSNIMSTAIKAQPMLPNSPTNALNTSSPTGGIPDYRYVGLD